MVNVVECCFRSCLCLCSRHSLAFCKCALKGPLWNFVDLSAGLCTCSSGSGVVCRSPGDWAASGCTPRVLSAVRGNGVESCLVACHGWCGEEALVRTGKRPSSSRGSLSPPSSFCTHSSSCCTCVCETSAAEATGTGKTGIRNFFILCCISACPELGNGREEKHKRENKSLEKFSLLPAWVGEGQHQSSPFAEKYWLFSSDQYLSLPTYSVSYL